MCPQRSPGQAFRNCRRVSSLSVVSDGKGGLEKCNGFLVFFILCVSSLSNLLLRLEEGKQMTQSWVEVAEINSQPVVCRGIERLDKLRHVKWPGPHYPCHYLYFPAWPDRSMGPLLTEIIQGGKKDCFVTALGGKKAESSGGRQRRRGECMTQRKVLHH